MKLLRYGVSGQERPGFLADDGSIRDLSGEIPDLAPPYLHPTTLARIAGLDPSKLPIVHKDQRLGIPFSGITKFIAIGLNYHDFAAEANRPLPTEPVVFTKAVSCLTGPADEVMLPRGSTHTDWEVELGVVIGTRARYIERSEALEHVAGYCLVNDITEREYQIERGGTWDKGKGCDTFGPVGPWLVTPDELADPQQLDLWLDVNGVRRQTGNTRTMIFPVAELVSYVSEFMTLGPGDILGDGNSARSRHGDEAWSRVP